MTIIAAFFGFIVFIFSCFTAGFKTALKRLMLFIGIGFIIDILILILAYAVTVGF